MPEVVQRADEEHKPSPAQEGPTICEAGRLQALEQDWPLVRPWEAHRTAASKGFTDSAPVCGLDMPISQMRKWRPVDTD